MKPNPERIYRDFESDRRIKRKNDMIKKRVRLTNRALRFLVFVQGFIDVRRVITSRMSKRFQVIKFIGEVRRIRANV